VSFRKHRPIPSLKHFPLPFSDAPGSVFVLPDDFQPKELAHISKLSFMLGSLAGPDREPPTVTTAGVFRTQKSQEENRNVILVGLPAENPVTLEANELLPQPFSTDGRSLQEGYGVQLPTADKQASLGLLQILPSPWVRGGTVLVITGNAPQGLEWTWNAVLDPAMRDRFAGNLMLVGSANRSRTAGDLSAPTTLQTLFQQIADSGNIPLVGPLLQSGRDFLGTATVAVGGALLLTVCAWWFLRAIRNRNASIPVRKEEEREEHD